MILDEKQMLQRLQKTEIELLDTVDALLAASRLQSAKGYARSAGDFAESAVRTYLLACSIDSEYQSRMRATEGK
mgnify:CR=1 FL=1